MCCLILSGVLWMILTYGYGKMRQFLMGLVTFKSPREDQMESHKQAEPQALRRSGASPAQRADEVQPCLGQGAMPTAAAALETGRGKFRMHSFTLCSVPSRPREDLCLKCSHQKYFLDSLVNELD